MLWCSDNFCRHFEWKMYIPCNRIKNERKIWTVWLAQPSFIANIFISLHFKTSYQWKLWEYTGWSLYVNREKNADAELSFPLRSQDKPASRQQLLRFLTLTGIFTTGSGITVKGVEYHLLMQKLMRTERFRLQYQVIQQALTPIDQELNYL